jgi:PilZ domain-containing protein
MSSNRRRSERYKIELPVRLKDAQGGEETSTANISAHGIAVIVERPRELRQYVELEITLPMTERRIIVTALVARIIDGLATSSGRRGRGLGLDFFLFDARAKSEWHDFIREVRRERSVAPPESAGAPRPDGLEPASTFLVRPRDLTRLWGFFRREMERGVVRIETPVPKAVGEPVEILVVHPITLSEWCLQGKVERSIDRRSGRPVLEIGLIALDEATREEFKAFVSSGEGMIQEDVPISTDLPIDDAVAPESDAEAQPAPAEAPEIPIRVPTSDLTIPRPPPGSVIFDLDEVVAANLAPASEPEDEKTVNVMPSIPRAISIAAQRAKDERDAVEAARALRPPIPAPSLSAPGTPTPLEDGMEAPEEVESREPGYGADPKSLSGKLFSSFFFEAAESQKPKKVHVAPPSKSAPRIELRSLGQVQPLPRATSEPKPLSPPPLTHPTPVFPAAADGPPPLPPAPIDPRVAGVVARPTPVLPFTSGGYLPKPEPSKVIPQKTRTPPPLPPPLPPSPAASPIAGAAMPIVRGAPDPDLGVKRTPPPLPPEPMPIRRTTLRPNIEEASTGAHRSVSTQGLDPSLDRDIALARARVVRSPNSVSACYRLGTLLLRRGDVTGFGEAIDTLHRVMELEPNHPGAHHAVAEALVRRGEYASAAEHLQKARRLGYQVDPELERELSERKRS